MECNKHGLNAPGSPASEAGNVGLHGRAVTAKLTLRRLLGKADAPTRERMLPLDPRPRLPQVVNLQAAKTLGQERTGKQSLAVCTHRLWQTSSLWGTPKSGFPGPPDRALQNISVLIRSVAQSCPTLCDPMDCSPTRLLCPWDSPGKNTGVGCHALLQGIFPTQGLNPHLLHCRWILNS